MSYIINFNQCYNQPNQQGEIQLSFSSVSSDILSSSWSNTVVQPINKYDQNVSIMFLMYVFETGYTKSLLFIHVLYVLYIACIRDSCNRK